MVDANAVPHCVLLILVSSATQRLAAEPAMLHDLLARIGVEMENLRQECTRCHVVAHVLLQHMS